MDAMLVKTLEESSSHQDLSQPGCSRSLWLSALIHAASFVAGLCCLAAWRVLRLDGYSTASMGALVAAGLLLFSSLHLVLDAVFAIGRRLRHAAHIVASLGFAGLAVGGHLNHLPVLNEAALAPFAMFGAVQALTHSGQPRNQEQAAALQHFLSGMREIEGLDFSGRSLEGTQHTAAVLKDLIARARLLGTTELRSDPGIQSALRQVAARSGLSLGMDNLEGAIDKLASQPGGERAAHELHRELTAARRKIAAGSGAASAEAATVTAGVH
jgi:hypothetical protein